MSVILTGSPWFVCQRPNPAARLRLFCTPFAGGSPLVYRKWAQALPTSVEVYSVHLPGRGSRLAEPPLRHMSQVIPNLAAHISPLLDRPFAFFGHSMGALLNFELTRHLQLEQQQSPVKLIVSGCRPPHALDRTRPLHRLSDQEFLEAMRALNGTPKEVLDHPELLALVMPVIRADLEVCETYRYEPQAPLDVPITAFGGELDPLVDLQSLEGWARHTKAEFSVVQFPGDHFFVNALESAVVGRVAAELWRFW